jgi:hypothetical protein
MVIYYLTPSTLDTTKQSCNFCIIGLTGVRSNSSLKGVIHMTICPIAIAVGCKKCPAFKFCPLTTVLGDQEEKDEFAQRKVWEENSPTADEHLNKGKELEKNNKEDGREIE